MRALQDKGSVMLVPGGQAELVHTWRIKHKKEYVVYGKHKGASLCQCCCCCVALTHCTVSFTAGPLTGHDA